MSKNNPALIRLAHPLAFAAFLEKVGAPVDGYFRRQGLPALCRDPNAYVPLHRAWGLFGDTARREGKDLAWQVGRYIGDRHLSAGLSHHLRSAPSLYNALQRFCRQVNSEASHLRLGIIERRSEVLFYNTGYFDWRDELGFTQSQAYQLELYLAFIRHFTGKSWTPGLLGICGSNIPKVAGKHFPGCRIKLEQPFSYIAIPRSSLHLTVQTNSDASPDSGVPILPSDLNFAENLALLIRPYLPEGYPSLRFAASLADTSVRTLSRRLANCGTSYQSLIDDQRFLLARELLRDRDASIRHVAAATGFRDQANFTRMFRRIGGLSPSEFRKELAS